MTAPATWLDRAGADAVLDDAVAGDPGAGLRLLVVDGPPGHGGGTLLGGVPRRAAATGVDAVLAGARDTDAGPSPLPDLAAALGGATSPRALARALADRARERPVVLAVDDAHRGGAAGRELLAGVLARLRHAPVRVVLRAWGGVGDPGGAIDTAARTVLTLGPVGPRAVRDALAAHGVAVPDAFVDDLVARTGGVPAVLAPVLRAVIRGAPASLDDPGPAEILACARREQDGRVLHALPECARALALVLALGGALPAHDALGPLAGLDPPELAVARRLLADGGLLRPDRPDRPDLTALRDDALGRRVLAGVEPVRRSDAARRAADCARAGGLPDETVARLLAAVGGPLPAWSTPILRRAAQRESRRDPVGARQDAGREAGTTRPGAATHLRLARRVAGLDADEDAGLRLDEAAELVADEPARSDRGLVAIVLDARTPALRVRAADQLVTRRPDRLTRDVVARALARTGIEEDERAALQALYWSVRHADEAPEGAREPRVEPLLDFPDHPEPAGVVALATARRGGPRSLPRVRALARLALADDGSGHRTTTSRLAACRALVLAEDLVGARRALAALADDPQVRGSRILRGAVRLAAVEVELRGGRLVAAWSTLREALRTAPATCWPAASRARFAAIPAQIALMRGDNEHATGWLARAHPGRSHDTWTRIRVRFVRGVHGLATGHWAAAGDQLQLCGRALAGVGGANPAVMPWRSLSAVTLHLRGETAAACALAEKEVELARAWTSPGALGWSLAVLGSVDGGAGPSLVTEGVEMLRRSELRHELAVATTLLAGTESDQELATAAARAAVRRFEETGALRGAERLRALIPAEPPAASLAAARGGGA